MGKSKYRFNKSLSFLVSLLLILIIVLSISTAPTSAEDDGVGVGVESVRPRIIEVQHIEGFRTEQINVTVFDLNGWRHISEVNLKFYRANELVEHYVFNQTEDLQRSIEVRKGDSLEDFESYSSERRETTEQRCNLLLNFTFRGMNYDSLEITAQDQDGGFSDHRTTFERVTAGREYTIYVLPFAVVLTGTMLYYTVKKSGGEIDE